MNALVVFIWLSAIANVGWIVKGYLYKKKLIKTYQMNEAERAEMDDLIKRVKERSLEEISLGERILDDRNRNN